jgi:hypothetical protein
MTKKMLIAAATWALASILAIPAFGQTNAVKVNIPFDFMLGEKTYPAGAYLFSSERDNIILAESSGRRLGRLLANHVSGRSGGATGQVVFQCYESQCFVSQIWAAGEEDGRELLRTRLERELAATKTRKYMALLGTSGRN